MSPTDQKSDDDEVAKGILLLLLAIAAILTLGVAAFATGDKKQANAALIAWSILMAAAAAAFAFFREELILPNIAPTDRWFLSSIVFFGMLILYPTIGALVSNICAALRRHAFIDPEPWSEGTIRLVAAFWPVSIVVWVVLWPIAALVNRVFP